MIYQPTDGDVLNRLTKCRPRTCFLMTQLGAPVPERISKIRKKLTATMKRCGIKILDASDEVTGRDFLLKIWEMILSVPMGVAVVDKEMDTKSLCNVYYEIGVMQAYGKETLVVKTTETDVPSDFVRTEYVTFDANFTDKIKKFVSKCEDQAKFYLRTAQNLTKNPPLSFDYYRRAYLMTGDKQTQKEALQVLETPECKEICNGCAALETSWVKS